MAVLPSVPWAPAWTAIPEANLILLEVRDGKLARKEGHILIHGGPFQLKPKTQGERPRLAKGVLFHLLIGGG